MGFIQKKQVYIRNAADSVFHSLRISGENGVLLLLIWLYIFVMIEDMRNSGIV